VLYLDSSALVKRYFAEPGSKGIVARLNREERQNFHAFTSVLAFAEIHATIRRRVRESALSEKEASRIQDQFDSDWLFSFTPIELSVGVLGFIRDILKKTPLTGADAIHLASALWIQDALKLGKQFGPISSREIVFACYDVKLCHAASSFGFSIFRP
jgi:uncharacterized protein